MVNSIYSLKKLKQLAKRFDRGNNSTISHSDHVANFALGLCKALNIRGKRRHVIITASLIHDVGKIVIDQQIWLKREKLTDAEWLKIRMHPLISAQLAEESGLVKGIVEAIYYHHVWFNGNGYPDSAGKRGQRIPIAARIIAICDAYEEITSDKVYKSKMTQGEALEELKRHAAEQFDPRLVEIFIKIVSVENKLE